MPQSCGIGQALKDIMQTPNDRIKLPNSTCPKCGNKLYLEKDTYGYLQTCLICGYNIDIDPEPLSSLDLVHEEKIK